MFFIFNQTDTPKVPLPVGHLNTPCNTCSWTHLTQHPKLHLEQFQSFLHSSRQKVPILYNMR